MSPRRVRGVCVECVEPARARGRCWTHYRLWRAATPEEQRERIPDGALVAGQVAAMLGITTASLTRRIARGQHRPDGRTSGRSWWWPATVAGWGLHRPSADALVVTEVAARLGVSTSQVHRLAQNPGPAGRRAARWPRGVLVGPRRRGAVRATAARGRVVDVGSGATARCVAGDGPPPRPNLSPPGRRPPGTPVVAAQPHRRPLPASTAGLIGETQRRRST